MSYNIKHQCSQRTIRRNKRRPEKKDRCTDPLRDSRVKKHPTKPRNQTKLAEIRAARARPHMDEWDFTDLAHDIRFEEEEDEAIERLLKYRRDKVKTADMAYDPYIEKLLEDPFLPHLYREDVNFSIYADGWLY